MQGKGLTPSQLHFQTLHPMGSVVQRSEQYTGLADAVKAFNYLYNPVEEVSYFKAYRGLREFGVYSVMTWCSVEPHEASKVCLIVVFGELNSDKAIRYIAPVQKSTPAEMELTPLEQMLAEEAFIRHNRHTQIQDELSQAVNNQSLTLFTAYYSKRNHITGQPNAKEYVWPVEAHNQAEAERLATEQLRTTSKHQVLIRRVVVGQ